MLQTAEEIIKYIGDAKKQTPIKMYLKGENLPDTDAFHLFGDSHFNWCLFLCITNILNNFFCCL